MSLRLGQKKRMAIMQGKIFMVFVLLMSVFRLIMLAGQAADAFTTPIVGLLSDKYESPRVGKRKFWYLCGFWVVALCFSITFQDCLLCKMTGD